MRSLVVVLLAGTLAACADGGGARIDRDASADRAGRALCGRVEGAKPWQRTELYFGLSKPDGSLISDAEYQRFLDTEVTPRFADGFTVLNGNGQFRGANGEIVRERSRAVLLFYAADEAKAAAVEEIRAAYKKQFQQESVMRVDAPSCVGF
jgi:hypothetical protein